MQDFIQDVVARLGTDEGTAKAATGGMLDLFKQNGDAGDVSEMFSKLPGAEDLLGAAPQEESGGGGLLGSIGGAIGDALGGGGDSALGALSALGKSGLSLDKIGDFASLFINFVKPKLGADLLGRLISKVPGLGNLVG